MIILFKVLKTCLIEKFSADELRGFIKRMDSGEGLSVFREALESALQSKENEEGQK